MYYPSETQVFPLVKIRRERVLPVPGEVVVGVGERVEPIQVVARTDLAGDFRIVPVARLLGIRASKVSRSLRVKLGDEVRQGQAIASRRGLNARSVKSPIDGMVTASGGGRVLIEAEPAEFGLSAYVHGIVTNVLGQRGVIVETTGALIQGLWGAGDEGFGVLKCVVNGPEHVMQANAIDLSCHGTILIGGAGFDEEALERAEQFQVRGIVTGGMPAEVIPRAERMPFPVVVTEGIGTVPMSTPIFRLLAGHDGREASISGRMLPRSGVLRPEVIVPLPAEKLPITRTPPGLPLTVGTQVRAVRAPYTGATGTVTALPSDPRRIETGAWVRGAEVDVGDDSPVFVPLANLEALR